MLNLKKQDISENNLSDKRIHELKGSLDFGSKLTLLAVLKVLDQQIDDWHYSFADTLNFELQKDGDEFSVKSTYNGDALDLTSESSNGILPLDKWTDYLIGKMYYGSITDLQKDSGAANPENHLTRDTADSESAQQWWSNQKKYEDRVLLKATLDTTALDLQTIDKAGAGASSDETATKSEPVRTQAAPSSTEVSFGSTSESDADTAIATDLTLGSNSDISDDMTFQFNTLDKIGKFERTSGEDISLAHGEQVSMGLDNVATKDVQFNLYKEVSFPTSQSDEVKFSNAHAVKLDGSEDVETSPSNKALQLNHYVPVEVDRLKATIDQDNAISLLGANNIPDNHVYSKKVRQNTLRPVTIQQGEHYKVDLSRVDPENAAVTRTSNGDDSIHIEGMSKTKAASSGNTNTNTGTGQIHIGNDGRASHGSSSTRTNSSPAVTGGSGTTVVQNKLSGGQTRPNYLILGGHR